MGDESATQEMEKLIMNLLLISPSATALCSREEAAFVHKHPSAHLHHPASCPLLSECSSKEAALVAVRSAWYA